MDELKELIQNKFAVVALISLGILGAVWATDFSLMDFVADRVIDRMELRYSPYGPEMEKVVPVKETK